MSAFRCHGGDCSILSVPYHGFGKDTQIYWIKTSDRGGDQPIAQAVVTSVTLEDTKEKVPYIITINVNLNPKQVDAVIDLIAHDFGVNKILLPNFDTSGPVVNTPEMKSAMTRQGSQDVRVRFSQGWEKASEFTVSNNNTGYENYYGEKGLAQAKLAYVKPIPESLLITQVIKQPYKKVSNFSLSSTQRKSYFRSAVSRGMNGEEKSKVLNFLGVDDAAVKAARPLARVHSSSGFRFSEYQEAVEKLGFTVEDVSKYHPFAATFMLSGFFEHLSDGEKRQVQKKLLPELRNRIEGDYANSNLTDEQREKIREDVDMARICFAYLLDGQNIISQIETSRLNAFLFASARRRLGFALRILLADPRVDPNSKDGDGKTPLHSAAINNNADALKILLADSRVDPNSKNSDGETPLHQVVSSNKVDTLKILLSDPRVDPNSKDRYGNTPLHLVAFRNEVDALKILLADPRVDTNSVDKYEKTPLHNAISSNKVDALKILLADPRVDPNIKEKNEKTPLNWAAFTNKVDALKILLSDPRVDPNSVKSYTTPLHSAVSSNKVDTLKILLADPRVDPNSKDKFEKTPLHRAISDNKVDALKILLADPRVDPNSKDGDGKTPLHRAAFDNGWTP